MNNYDNTIYFFYPSKTIGGAELLFFRYYKSLKASNINIKFLVIDNEQIYFKFKIEKNDSVNINNFNKTINQCTVIIPPNTCNKNYLNYFIGCKLIVWSLHPGLIIQNIHGKFKYLNKIILQQTYKKIIHQNGLWFLDEACSNPLRTILNLNFKPVFMPIILEELPIIKKNRINEDYLSIAFVGRLENAKINAIIHLLNNIKNSNVFEKSKYIIHIIGDGTAKEKLLNVSRQMENIIFHGSMENDKMKAFLSNYVDVTFAMGQSLIDAAMVGNLAVKVDLHPNQIEQEHKINYDFIYDSINFSMGDIYNKNVKKKYSFEYIEELIFEKDKLSIEKQKCKKFALDNFKIDNTRIDNFVKNIALNQFILNKKNIKMLSNTNFPTFLKNLLDFSN
jgi:hypothetical protein